MRLTRGLVSRRMRNSEWNQEPATMLEKEMMLVILRSLGKMRCLTLSDLQTTRPQATMAMAELVMMVMAELVMIYQTTRTNNAASLDCKLPVSASVLPSLVHSIGGIFVLKFCFEILF